MNRNLPLLSRFHFCHRAEPPFNALIIDSVDVPFQDGPALVKKVKGTFAFKCKKGNQEAVWFVDVKNGSGAVKFGATGEFCSFLLSHD